MLVFSIVITLGVAFGKLKIKGVSLGLTWILFVGIVVSHFGMLVDHETLHFVREFGLILFVYSIGLQVGPSFFSSFREGGLKLNSLAVLVVLCGVGVTCGLYFLTGLPMSTMVGIMSGAVTNTPGLGAAQQTYTDMIGHGDPTIALGYAVAYPLGVAGMIGSLIFLKYAFRVNFDSEKEMLRLREGEKVGAQRLSLLVKNPSLFGMNLSQIVKLVDRHFVVSRICHESGQIEIGSANSVLSNGDKILVIVDSKDMDFVTAFIGDKIDMEWQKLDSQLVSRRIMITSPKLNGKTLGKMGLFGGFSFNITRVNRAGIDLVAHHNLKLQMGDRVTVVGSESAIANVEKVLGNSMKRLREPNLIPIFMGIFLGVVLGSVPFFIPGIPQPVKLGMAGGPLVVSILISRFGPKFNLITYTTVSANLMLREIGISLFLAAVGIGAGKEFFNTIVENGGYVWIGYGAAITILPVTFVGIIARKFFKIDYFTMMGLLSGGCTNPPALAYCNGTAGNDLPAVAYATVYPLTMFCRVLAAQLLILFFCNPPTL